MTGDSERRKLFFSALGKEDDGRFSPIMAREEFLAFNKPIKEDRYDLKDKKTVLVFFEFAPFEDISYTYCFDDDTVYESRYNIGD